MSKFEAFDTCVVDPSTGHCATCADEGLEGRILAIGDDGFAEVELEGRVRDVAVDFVDGAGVGDLVLVHAGVAIARVEADGDAAEGREA